MPRYPTPERAIHLDFSRLVAKRIAARRRELDMTQQQLGEHLGLTREVITRVETNRATLTAGDMPAVALALRVPVSFFYSVDTIADAELVLAGAIKKGFSATLQERLKAVRAIDTGRAVVNALRRYVSESGRGKDPEIAEMLGVLDSDLREALRRMARILYDLHLQRPIPGSSSHHDLKSGSGNTGAATTEKARVIQYLADMSLPPMDVPSE